MTHEVLNDFSFSFRRTPGRNRLSGKHESKLERSGLRFNVEDLATLAILQTSAGHASKSLAAAGSLASSFRNLFCYAVLSKVLHFTFEQVILNLRIQNQFS